MQYQLEFVSSGRTAHVMLMVNNAQISRNTAPLHRTGLWPFGIG